jgi:pimeloyl-ACP methyl ester carboxylesterase
MLGQVRAEFEALSETGRETLAAPPPPERIPVAILVAPDPANAEIAAFDNALRADYKRLYPKARFSEVEGGHEIPLERPEAVAEALRAVLAAGAR